MAAIVIVAVIVAVAVNVTAMVVTMVGFVGDAHALAATSGQVVAL
jgi:hypothetical protein